MPDLTAVIAKIQELRDQAAHEMFRAKHAERASREAGDGQWEDYYRSEAWAWGARQDAYFTALELLKEVDGGA